MTAAQSAAAAAAIASLVDRRNLAGVRLFEAEAERIARLTHRMAERFARGGRLLAIGASPADCSDVRHLAVEFVHPVIVGKRALPAIGLTRGGGPLGLQVDVLAKPDDIVVAFGAETGDREILQALEATGGRGCLTLAFAEVGAAWQLPLREADAFVRQELIETLYHVLWELVHVFFEHRGLLEGRRESRRHATGASSFLYPFLGQGERDLERVVADVAASVREKGSEAAQLRAQTLEENSGTLAAAAVELRLRLAAGGKVLAAGNGGSATDAMDLVADLRAPPGGGEPLAALDLTEDTAVLTALANDVGPDLLFSRQVIAHGGDADALVVFSTSGGSPNVVEALGEARRRGLATIAFVGYAGGRVAEEGLADHVIVTRSEHVPRIQEAQAAGYHALCGMLRDGVI